MLHFDSRGQGSRQTLLVHGFLGAGRNLTSFARKLAEARGDASYILPDLRGHGASPPLARETTLEALAQDIVELAASVSPHQPIDLIGHSLGGRVALLALAAAPEQFGRVVLLDISPAPVPVLGAAMQRVFERLMGAPTQASNREAMRAYFLEGGVVAGLADWMLTNLEVHPEGGVTWRFDRAALASLHYKESAQDLWAVPEQHGKRLEVIRGGASTFVPQDHVRRLQAMGARVETLPGAGHFLHVDALEPLVAVLAAPPLA